MDLREALESSVRTMTSSLSALVNTKGLEGTRGSRKDLSLSELDIYLLCPGPWMLLVIGFLKTTGSPSSSAWRLSLEPNQYLVSTWPNQALRLQMVDPIDFLHNGQGQGQGHRHHRISDYLCPPNSLSTGNSN